MYYVFIQQLASDAVHLSVGVGTLGRGHVESDISVSYSIVQ